jgi:signal transduction histidine kinase
MRRPGLRARVRALFATSALVLSAAMALLSYQLTRGSLLAERERTATRTTYFDATVVQAGRHGGGPVAIRLTQQDGVRVIEVDDDGPGVVPEDRDIIFQPFVRGRGASARGDGEGTGLGLALVAQHVDVHGGRVSVVDRPGGGARFRVELPGGDQ